MYTTNECSFGDNLSDIVDNYLKQKMKSYKPSHPWNPTYGITKLRPTIKKVVFNDPATIILWNDNTKTVVKAQNGEPYDKEKGFVMAYLKKLLGNDNTFNKEIHTWVTE